MIEQQDELLALLARFYDFNVAYLIIGGFAVNRYGFKRTTGDIDFLLKDTPDNRRNLIDALDAMGYGRFDPLMTAPIMAGYCEIMLDNGMYADLMTDVPGLEPLLFDTYKSQAMVDIIQNIPVYFINYQQLIDNKKATGRSKDLIDIEELQKLKNTDR